MWVGVFFLNTVYIMSSVVTWQCDDLRHNHRWKMAKTKHHGAAVHVRACQNESKSKIIRSTPRATCCSDMIWSNSTAHRTAKPAFDSHCIWRLVRSVCLEQLYWSEADEYQWMTEVVILAVISPALQSTSASTLIVFVVTWSTSTNKWYIKHSLVTVYLFTGNDFFYILPL